MLGRRQMVAIENAKVIARQPRRTPGFQRVDHFGSPDPAQGVACGGFKAVLDGVRAGDTWVKLSAPYRQGGANVQRYVDALIDAGGPQQLVWGSDWPFVSHEDEITYQDCVGWLSEWVPDEHARRIILVETPMRLFGFEVSEAVRNA